MKLNTYCCLFVCVRGWNVTAGKIHRVVNDTNTVTLPCHRSVDGSVTWSRDTNGSKVDLIIACGTGDKRLNDPKKRFASLGDEFKTLRILKASVSDSGRYFCNDEAAADLTVIPSGTRIENVTEGTRVTLNCPHPIGGSRFQEWSKQIAGKPQRIRPRVSTADKTLVLIDAKPADSGLYFCGEKAAAYLAVNEASPPPPYLLMGVGIFILLIIIIFYFTRRFKLKKRDLHHSAGVDEAVYYMIDCPDGSKHNDCTYATIPHLPQTGNSTGC
ncbi:uncharacterized protein LOC110959378 isoform X2 [Acanthochromis polyacanthus]|uniref:uncharacterized protein LOC110959378 isoform X2 n=1 Tax=Acanthochromis polyacanthus TaxID=80966 RepID=UPI0022344649|nr:uncharacterized protein LOC110959378 isoform X2 [Acanthochromis polyacanthus]